MIPTVPHRMGGLHARKDPLMDEKLGSAKRKKSTDGSDLVYYRETEVEKAAARKAEKKAKKAAEQPIVQTESAAPSKAPVAVGSSARTGAGTPSAAHAAMQAQMASFKDRLKGSALPSEAEASEKRKKEEFAAEVAASNAAIASKEQKPAVEDPDNPITFAQIWQEGDEQTSENWLEGGGLKFHTTADKAFAMDSRRFKETVESQDASAENREAMAEIARKRGESKMAEFKYSKGASAKR
mmetsp:Transcript_60679/g.112575  ORF Transcript_60679/g.112575 Transcript_60679/m.112575 type:complete len:240 (+) Transcript_60679:75-794(+)